MTPTSRSGTFSSGVAPGDGSWGIADGTAGSPATGSAGAKPIRKGGCWIAGFGGSKPRPQGLCSGNCGRAGVDCGSACAGHFGLWTLDFRLALLRRDGLGFGLLSVEGEQCFLHRLGDQFPDFKFAVEFHLALGRVDVHVHGGGINFQKQAADRVAAFHQRGVIALEQRVIEAAVFDRTAVDEQVLAFARRA
jgi:hypothetical protein